MDPSSHLEHLQADIERIRATRTDHLGAAVRACPGWSVGDLLAHHAGVFRFVVAQLRAEPGSDLVPFDPPDADMPPVEMFSIAADELSAALRDTDPTEHRPNWAGAPTAAFWFRRMAQETVIHRVDVQLAHTTPDPVDPALAVDGIDELADVFLPYAGARGITGAGETVHLHATDDVVSSGEIDGGEWTFRFHGEGVDVERGHAKGDMAVRGPAGQLLLFAWNRRPVDVECFGEPGALAFWAQTVRI